MATNYYLRNQDNSRGAKLTKAQADGVKIAGLPVIEVTEAVIVPVPSSFDSEIISDYRVSVIELGKPTSDPTRTMVAHISECDLDKTLREVLSVSKVRETTVSNPETLAIKNYARSVGIDPGKNRVTHAAHQAWGKLDPEKRSDLVTAAILG